MIYKNREASVYIGAIDSSIDQDLTGLRTKFEVKKSNKKEANTAKIDIYNMSNNSYEILKNSGRLRVVLEAGYEDGKGIIFQGDVVKFTKKPGDKDVIYTVEAKDSLYTLRNLRTSVSYEDGTSLRTIINDMAKKMNEYSGIIMGNIDAAVDRYKVEHGITLIGQLDDVLNELTDDYLLSWRFEDGVLFVEDVLGADYQDTAIILSSGVISKDTGLPGEIVGSSEFNTGLVGFPEWVDSGQKATKKKKTTPKKVEKGLKVVSLLNPFYKIYKRIDLRSNYYEGEYKIKEITFKGDTHGKEWYAELLLI